MSLLQQFLFASLIPGAFLALAVLAWRAPATRPAVKRPWLLALLSGALWSSGIVSHYVGVGVSPAIPYTWRIVGAHALTLLAFWLLWTTFSYLDTDRPVRQVGLGLAGLLAVAAVALNPEIWSYDVRSLTVLGRSVRFFDIWGGFWVAAWLIPLGVAWDVTRQAFRRLPASRYRNQLHYWWLGLTFLLGGGLPALARASEQVALQQGGALLMLAGAVLGSIGLGRNRSPDLARLLRRAIRQLSGAAALFVMVVALLWLVRRQPLGRSLTEANAGILVAAALFTALYLLIRRLLRAVADQAFLPAARLRRLRADLWRATLDPEQVAQLVLSLAERLIGSDERWLFTAETGVGGQLVLRPLRCEGPLLPETAVFAADSPFTIHLRDAAHPLIYRDIGSLTTFDPLPAGERAVLTHWEREAFLPLRDGDRLVGVLALGGRRDGLTYGSADLARLAHLAGQVAGPLHEALRLAAIRRIASRVLDEGAALLREKQALEQESILQGQFVRLIAPDLRRPLDEIDAAWHEIESRLATVDDVAPEPEPVAAGRRRRSTRKPPPRPEERLSAAVQELRARLDHLIGLAAHVGRLGPLEWEPLYLDDLCRKTIARLTPMAEARHVTLKFSSRTRLPPVTGDAERLMEALRHLLHNAIKFSRIGGEVTVLCEESGNEVRLEICDGGVGIPEERLERIWSTFEQREARAPAGGLGLGLPLARAIILAHGGRISLTSKHGSGSTFTLHLPLTLDE